MAVYTPVDQFGNIEIYDTNTPVLGGTSGDSNTPIKQLADAVTYTKNRLYRYDDVVELASNTTITSAHIGKMISCTVAALGPNFTLTLSALSNFPLGTVLAIKATCAPLKNITIVTSSSQLIFLNSNYMEQEIFMHDGEVLYLLRDGGYWTVIAYKGNFENVGQCVSGYVQHSGTLIRNGSVINRDAYPRLWKWINEKLTLGQQKTDDTTWQSDAFSLPTYRGLFSTGNGTTTFRLPDDRGMFDRYLDSGRGLDVDRLHNYAGGFENEQFKEHNHTIATTNSSASISDGADPVRGSNTGPSNSRGGSGSGKTIGMAGGSETRPKNNAKLPLIIY